MKRALSYAAVFLAGSLLSGGVAVAATTYVQAQKGTSVIELDGSKLSAPPKLVYSGTTYVQLYSIQQGLKQAFGTQPTWDGTTFNMITSKPQPASVITFSNATVKSDGLGDTEVDGEVTNNDTVSHSFLVTVTFFDASGKILGTASGAVDEIAAGETKTYQALGSGDYTNAASFKVQYDALS